MGTAYALTSYTSFVDSQGVMEKVGGVGIYIFDLVVISYNVFYP